MTTDEFGGARNALVRWASSDSTGTRLLNALVVLAVLVAAASVAQALVTTDGPGATETYLLTENESGELVADDYPTNLTRGESGSLILGMENHWDRPVDYTAVVQLQRVSSNDTSNAVVETQSVARFTRSLAPGERAHVQHAVEPNLTGDRLRLTYLVYAGEPPDDPTVANADSEVHLWLSVRGQGSTTNARSCPFECA